MSISLKDGFYFPYYMFIPICFSRISTYNDVNRYNHFIIICWLHCYDRLYLYMKNFILYTNIVLLRHCNLGQYLSRRKKSWCGKLCFSISLWFLNSNNYSNIILRNVRISKREKWNLVFVIWCYPTIIQMIGSNDATNWSQIWIP